MTRPVRIALSVCVVCFAGFLAWFFLRNTAKDPICQGKRVSQWVNEAVTGPRQPETFSRYAKMLGAPAVPFLEKALETEDTSTRKTMAWIKSHSPGFLARQFADYPPAFIVRQNAAAFLREFGQSAAGAVPALCRMAQKDPDHQARVLAAMAIARLAPYAKGASPFMQRVLLTDSDADLRRAAALYFSRANLPSPLTVPSMIKGLQDRDVGVRNWCAYTLGVYGAEATGSIGALTKLAQSDDPASTNAAVALKKIQIALQPAGSKN